MVLTVPLKLTVPLWSSAAREFLCGPVVLLTVPLAGSSGFELKLECMDHCYRIGDRGRNIGCFCPVSVRRQSGVGTWVSLCVLIQHRVGLGSSLSVSHL